MEKIWKEKAVRVTASYRNFDGNIQQWKDAFYELWRYQLTYSMAYNIELLESNSSGVFVSMLVREAYKEPLLNTMDSLGYKEVNAYEDKVGIVECTDTDVDEIVVE